MQFYSTWRKPKISGIYGFFHRASGKCYVGSAVDLFCRRRDHIYRLRAGTSQAPKFQRAWDKYGEDAFTWCIIEVVADPASLIEREQYWIDWLNSCKGGYNTSPTAGNTLGVSCSAEKAAKIAAALRGRKGYTPSEEQRAYMSALFKGRHVSAETRQKLREHNLGKPRSPEASAKAADKLRGRKRPAEFCARQSELLRELFAQPEMKAKLLGRGKGLKKSPEQVEMMRQRACKLTESDVLEIRRRHAEGGVTLKSLAADHGVRLETIWHIVHRKTWRHI